MDAALIIADWQSRLVAMAENPPYVFLDTPQHLIEEHHKRFTTFIGYSEEEVATAEERLAVRFPEVFQAYLVGMGKSPGDLFRGSDLAGLRDFERLRLAALALMAKKDPGLSLPQEAVVFLFHQGYTFVYLQATGGFDGPMWQYLERGPEVRQCAPTFAGMVDAELHLMERNDTSCRNNGGYYLTLHPEGGATQEFPARNSGDRPLERKQQCKGE